MTCLTEHHNGPDLLVGYLEATLSPELRVELERHAAACPECAGLLGIQQTLAGDSDEFVPAVSPGFDQRLMARIAQEQQGRTQARPSWWNRMSERLASSFHWSHLIPVAAAAAVFVAVVWIEAPGNSPASAPPVVEKAAVQKTQGDFDFDVTELEQALEDVELLLPPGA